MAEQNIDPNSFLSAFDQEDSGKKEIQQSDSASNFLKAFDSFDEIDLSKSALDISLEDRFTRNRALQELYSKDQISSSTYYDKLEPLTAEEAAYLESQETGTAQALKMILASAVFANGTDTVQRALAEAS